MKPLVTFWPKLNAELPGAEWAAPDWRAILDRLSQPRPFSGDFEHPGWSPARFDPCLRSLENLREATALCFDFDKGTTIAEGLERFAPFFGLLHTTRSHTPEAHRFRVVLPLARAISRFEYYELWKRVSPLAGRVDGQTKDPSRFWYLPGPMPGGEFLAERLNGEPLDPDEWLAKPDPTARPVDVPRTVDLGQVERRAVAYLAKMPEAISGAGGHPACWKAACVLACGFDLSEDATFAILWNEYNPRCSPPWSEKELRHKARQARERSRLAKGYLLTGPAYESGERQPDREVQYDPPPREPGDDTDEIEAERPTFETHGMNQERKPIHERFAISTERDVMLEVFEQAKIGKAERGYTTGIWELDNLLGGLRRGNCTLLAAQTSWGKSSYGVMVSEENRSEHVKVCVVSNEDKRLMYGRRMMCRRTGINALRVRDNELKPEEIARFGAIAGHASDDYIFFDAIGLPVEQAAAGILELCKEHGVTLVICDYLQRWRALRKMQDRRNEVSYVAEQLGNAIKLGNAAGLLLSQLKRVDGREPTMDDVKESGDLENMAEHVLIGWRDVKTGNARNGEEDRVMRKVNLPKNKDGPVSLTWIELGFDDVTANFKASWKTGRAPPYRSEAVSQLDDFGEDWRNQ